MDHRIYLRVRPSILILLIAILCPIADQGLSPLSSVTAQKTSFQAGQSKTNGLTSSKFKESISQFRRKQQQQQPIFQQQSFKVNFTNEQQVVEQPRPLNQIVEEQLINSQQQRVVEQSYDSQQQSIDSHSESIYGSVKGTPGVDFPNYSVIPNTKFSCDGVPFEPGMYADEETACQAYHLCYQGRRESFLCGVGTVFNQAIMNCDFWHSVDCSKSSQFYGLNAEFGKSSSEPTNNLQSISQSSVSRIEQAQIPARTFQQQQQQVFKQSSVVLPSRPNIVRSEENFRSVEQFSGKVSPPKQQINTNFVAQSLSATGGTKSVPRSSVFESQQINLQRNGASGFVSPGRKAAFLKGQSVNQQQFALAESSPMRSFTTDGTKSIGRTQSKVDSSSSDSHDESVSRGRMIFGQKETLSGSQNENNVDVGGQKRPFEAGKSVSSKQNSLLPGVGTKTPNEPSSTGNSSDGWKPYFKSKTKPGDKQTEATRPPAPVNHGTSSTKASSMEENTQADMNSMTDTPSPTLAQPDQEPTFSPEQSSSQATEAPSSDVPSIPKSNVPPPSPTTTEEPATSDSPAATESDVSSAPSTTTQADSDASSEGPATTSSVDTTTTGASESPQTTTTSSQTTTEASSSSETLERSDAPTTTEMPQSTTTTPAPPVTTTMTSQAEDETTASAATGEEGAPSQEKKKKRGTPTIGVEYAKEGPIIARPSARVNSSSVEYVTIVKP